MFFMKIIRRYCANDTFEHQIVCETSEKSYKMYDTKKKNTRKYSIDKFY